MDFADKITIYIPGVVMVLYAITGIAYLYKKNYPFAIVWLAYSLANLGLILAGNK